MREVKDDCLMGNREGGLPEIQQERLNDLKKSNLANFKNFTQDIDKYIDGPHIEEGDA